MDNNETGEVPNKVVRLLLILACVFDLRNRKRTHTIRFYKNYWSVRIEETSED
jgi:hypothetical protein